MKNKIETCVQSSKWQFILLLIFLFPIVCYGQGQQNAVAFAEGFILFWFFLMFALSIYLLIKVINNGKGLSRLPYFILSLIIVYAAVNLMIPSMQSDGMDYNEYSSETEKVKETFGFILLLPNVLLLVLILINWINEYNQKRRSKYEKK